jgi:dienelactone hydrolase
MLVIDRPDLPAAAAWCEALRADGVVLDDECLPGYEGLMAVPHLTVLPQQLLDRAVAWLTALPPLASPWAPAQTMARATLALTGGVTEQPIRLMGSIDEPALWSIHTVAADQRGPQAGLAVLVLNTGAERRVGPHGQFVEQARRWAAQGATVLRLDLAGLGDSPAAPGREEHRVYSDIAMHDVRRALAWLRAQPGVQRVAVLGLCSGAFHAFEAASQHLPLDVAVMINPLVFFRPERVDFDAVPAQDHAVQQLSSEALRNLRDPARWRKLLSGEVNYAFILATLGRRVGLAAKRVGRLLARGVGLPLVDDLAGKLRRAAVHHRGNDVQPRLHFVFAAGDPGQGLLEAEAGRTLRVLQRQGRVAVQRVAAADHTFSRAAARLQLQAVLDAVLAQAAPARQAAGGLNEADQAVAWASSTRRARCASASST